MSEPFSTVSDSSSTPPVGHDALEWHRVHRVTPFVRAWLVLVVLVVGGSQSFSDVFSGDPLDGKELRITVLIMLGVVVFVLLVTILYGWLAWRRMSYAYDYESVFERSGVLFRKERKVRLDRIQTIDIVRPLVARLFGLAELSIKSASGGESDVSVGFIKDNEAEQLRIELLARASGAVRARRATHTPQAGPVAGELDGATATVGVDPLGQPLATSHSSDVAGEGALPQAPMTPGPYDGPTIDVPERQLYQVPPARIIGSALLTTGSIVTLIVLITMGVLVSIGKSGVAFSFLPLLLGFAPLAWNRFAGEYGFTAAISPDGVRVRNGLLETRAQTIPPGRVQSVRIRQSLLWRKFGWWRVDIIIPGGMTSEDMKTLDHVLLPVGDRTQALDALWLVLPNLGVDDPLSVLDAALTGTGSDGGFVTSPSRARWLDPLSWRRNGYLVTDTAVLIRTGRFTRSVKVVPHERTQSIAAKQGPWQRSLKVATIELHSTPGMYANDIPHVDEHVARALVAEQSVRSRAARKHAGPEQWLAQVQQAPSFEAQESSAPPFAAPPVQQESSGLDS